MTKEEAIKLFVDREFHPIPLEWVQIIAEKLDAEIYSWPMWGTMWQIDSFIAERLLKHSQVMVGEASEIDLDAIEDEQEKKEVKTAIEDLKKESIAWGGCAILEKYVNEEMAGATNITGTAAFIYKIDGQYLIGINGAGWDFYNGVWDRLYDICEMEWHDKETKE